MVVAKLQEVVVSLAAAVQLVEELPVEVVYSLGVLETIHKEEDSLAEELVQVVAEDYL